RTAHTRPREYDEHRPGVHPQHDLWDQLAPADFRAAGTSHQARVDDRILASRDGLDARAARVSSVLSSILAAASVCARLFPRELLETMGPPATDAVVPQGAVPDSSLDRHRRRPLRL